MAAQSYHRGRAFSNGKKNRPVRGGKQTGRAVKLEKPRASPQGVLIMAYNEKTRKAVDRLEIVSAYLSRGHDAVMFARLYNAGDILRQLREETGPVDAEDLDRWADICMAVAEDAAREDSEDGGEPDLSAAVIRSQRAALAAGREQARSDAAVIRSLNRYIAALEGRDGARVRRIRELEALCGAWLDCEEKLRKNLSGVLPGADFFAPAKTGESGG